MKRFYLLALCASIGTLTTPAFAESEACQSYIRSGATMSSDDFERLAIALVNVNDSKFEGETSSEHKKRVDGYVGKAMTIIRSSTQSDNIVVTQYLSREPQYNADKEVLIYSLSNQNFNGSISSSKYDDGKYLGESGFGSLHIVDKTVERNFSLGALSLRSPKTVKVKVRDFEHWRQLKNHSRIMIVRKLATLYLRRGELLGHPTVKTLRDATNKYYELVTEPVCAALYDERDKVILAYIDLK